MFPALEHLSHGVITHLHVGLFYEYLLTNYSVDPMRLYIASFLLTIALPHPGMMFTWSSLPHEILGRQAMCPEQAWPCPALTETWTEGLDLSGSHRVNSPIPENLPTGARTSEGTSVLLGNMEDKMRIGMEPSSISTESSRGEYCEIRFGETTNARCFAMWRMTTKAREQMWPKISQWVDVLQIPERVRGRKCDLSDPLGWPLPQRMFSCVVILWSCYCLPLRGKFSIWLIFVFPGPGSMHDAKKRQPTCLEWKLNWRHWEVGVEV